MGFWEFLETYSGAFIALLTGALVFTTIIYVVVSWKLLKQSRNAFRVDIVLRVMETCRKEIKEIKKGEVIKEVAFIKAGMKAYSETFMKIDKRLGMDTAKLFKVYLDVMFKEKKKVEKRLKEKEERNRGSGTS